KEAVAAKMAEFTDDELAAMGLSRKPQKTGVGLTRAKPCLFDKGWAALRRPASTCYSLPNVLRLGADEVMRIRLHPPARRWNQRCCLLRGGAGQVFSPVRETSPVARRLVRRAQTHRSNLIWPGPPRVRFRGHP